MRNIATYAVRELTIPGIDSNDAKLRRTWGDLLPRRGYRFRCPEFQPWEPPIRAKRPERAPARYAKYLFSVLPQSFSSSSSSSSSAVFRVIRAKLPSLAFSIHPSSILQTASIHSTRCRLLMASHPTQMVNTRDAGRVRKRVECPE